MLTVGVPIERELAGEQTHTYTMLFEAGQYLRGVVEQKGVDIIVSVVSPDGKTIWEMDTPTGTQGTESFFAITSVAGKYQIIVRAPEKKAPTGRYAIKLEEARAAREEDQLRITATITFHQADRLLDEQKAEAFTQALPKFQEALSLWEKLNDLKMQATTLHNMGYTAGAMSNTSQAIQYNEQALQLRRRLGDRAGEGDSLSSLATSWAELGNFDEALAYYAQARDIYHAIDDFAYEARILANMGQVWRNIGENQKAIDVLNQALPITRTTKRTDIEAYTLEGLGHAYAEIGDDAQALTSYDLGLLLAKAQKRRDLETRLLVGKGNVLYRNARQAEAMTLVNQGLAICRERGNRYEEVTILTTLTRMHNENGDPATGLKLAQQALEISQQLDDRSGQANARLHIGQSQALLNEETSATENFQTARALSRTICATQLEAQALYHLARLDQRRGKLADARAQSEALLTILETLRSRVTNQQLRTTFFARLQQYYDFHIALLQELQRESPNGEYAAEALYTSERARARVAYWTALAKRNRTFVPMLPPNY